MIRCMVDADSPRCLAADEGEGSHLQGWILRYKYGALGMLHVEPECRRRGIASHLVGQATSDLAQSAYACFAYIVDGNLASERVFGRLGWRRAADADWVGFAAAEDPSALVELGLR